MAIFIRGDVHGQIKYKFIQQLEVLTEEDVLLIVGDFGFIWFDSSPDSQVFYDKSRLQKNIEEQEKDLDKISSLTKGIVMFIDGNHENFNKLNSYPVTEKFGGKVHEIRPNIFHMMRGEIFTIENKKFFAMGGALSHDIGGGILDVNEPTFHNRLRVLQQNYIPFRIKNISWWEEEIPSKKEINRAITNLSLADWKVDYILTHMGTADLERYRFLETGKDGATKKQRNFYIFLDFLFGKSSFKKWYLGHYHAELIYGQLEVLYDNMKEIR